MMSSFNYNTLFFVRHMHAVICFCICICLCIYSCSVPVEISERCYLQPIDPEVCTYDYIMHCHCMIITIL